MKAVSSLHAVTWLILIGSLLPLGVLGGCAAGGPVATAGAEAFTESDEPDSRKRASIRLKLAVLYFQDGKYAIAMDETKQAILIDPNWFESYGMRGLIYLQTGDYGLAESSFQKALTINPQSSDTKHNYGFLLCKMQRPEEAMQLFGAALADPGYGQRAKTWAELGHCQLANGQKTEAEASYLRSYELDAGNPATGLNLASLLYQRGESDRAQFYARRINDSEQASAESLWLGIKIARSLGSVDAQAQLGTQLRRRFGQSTQALALERGAFNE
jgi:type IV pilus assembly protein PilF